VEDEERSCWRVWTTEARWSWPDKCWCKSGGIKGHQDVCVTCLFVSMKGTSTCYNRYRTELWPPILHSPRNGRWLSWVSIGTAAHYGPSFPHANGQLNPRSSSQTYVVHCP